MFLSRWLPGLANLLQYRREWFRHDLQAGLSVAAIQIPIAIAYAQIVGLPPQYGLYACILPMMVYALIGSSRQLMVGPDAATCAMVAGAIAPLAMGDPARLAQLSVIVTILVGLMLIGAGLARAGFIASFFSRPILIGYLNGIGLSLLAGQLGKVLGFQIEGNGFIFSLINLLQRLGDIHWPTLGIGVAGLALLIWLPRRYPHLPAALVTVAVATLVVGLFSLDRFGVAILGPVPAGMPQLAWPKTNLEEMKSLLRDALGIATVSFCSAMLTARSFAACHGYSINANHEFLALGVTNIAAGVSQGFAISGADSRTAVNDMVGGKSQLVGIIAASVIALILLAFTTPLAWIPQAALGAVLLMAGWGLIDVQSLRKIYKLSRFEFWLCVLTTIGVLGVGVLPGIIIAVTLAILRLLQSIYQPTDAVLGWVPGIEGQVDIRHHKDARTVQGLVVYRFDDAILFFNADYFKMRLLEAVQHEEQPRAVLFDAEAVSSIDVSGIAALREVCDTLKARGIYFGIARARGRFLRMLIRSGLAREMEGERLFGSVRSGIRAYRLWRNRSSKGRGL
ncbi:MULTISPECIES: SulP family inorganic anion transporter [Pseudomonas]|jgi:high affinity sulfate transporter 1|uniref:SulP family inorganic anion transporter n=5 Tax=Gammaproteobacteria TaxID=1236 RepID=A0A7Y1FC87_PSEVE|nr:MULTISPECIES: SulP family inorganic anion transporter [Pseudomonas]AEV63311.1 sulfate-transport transmembrane protein abc transporter [Pseudomonas ogarae]AUO47180.1 C4-dicarboxylic acid transporter DauA [Pseudomonas ogarae]MBI6552547.1 SulP family inorganic anion transporter [Pseudomonas veronii]MBI6605700.1 SulP family inorganic anion transporter [Pseudomonas sp. S4_EA_1b]MBI6627777.1 SulP family inorganic anion transporter [Pseudomonas rhodesiae]